jgi:hypothetical protein
MTARSSFEHEGSGRFDSQTTEARSPAIVRLFEDSADRIIQLLTLTLRSQGQQQEYSPYLAQETLEQRLARQMCDDGVVGRPTAAAAVTAAWGSIWTIVMAWWRTEGG